MWAGNAATRLAERTFKRGMASRGAIAACILLANLFSSNAWSETSKLAGNWFTEGTEKGVYAQFIHERRADGIFFAHIRELDHCRPVRQWLESGTWDFANGSIHQITQFVDNEPSQFEDEYRVLSQSRDSVLLLDLETGIKWPSARVGPTFKFPPPKNCPVS